VKEFMVPSDVPHRFRWRLERTAREYPERFNAELELLRNVLAREMDRLDAQRRRAVDEERRHP
jgi:hypothetical protein